jgi:hypothetical protein
MVLQEQTELSYESCQQTGKQQGNDEWKRKTGDTAGYFYSYKSQHANSKRMHLQYLDHISLGWNSFLYLATIVFLGVLMDYATFRMSQLSTLGANEAQRWPCYIAASNASYAIACSAASARPWRRCRRTGNGGEESLLDCLCLCV